MHEEVRLMWGIIGLVIASGILTYFTKPSENISVSERRKKKRNKKLRLRDAQPYLTEDGFVALTSDDKRLTTPYTESPDSGSYTDRRQRPNRSEINPSADIANS
jgi:hypothetical protein